MRSTRFTFAPAVEKMQTFFLLPKKTLVEGCPRRVRYRGEVSRECPRRPEVHQRASWGLLTPDPGCTSGLPTVYLGCTYGVPWATSLAISVRISKIDPPMTAPIECLRSDLVLCQCKCVVLLKKNGTSRFNVANLGSTEAPEPPREKNRRKRTPIVPAHFIP